MSQQPFAASPVFLGIDIGTQSAKCVLLGSDGTRLGVGQSGYPIATPRADWAEQAPADWWVSTIQAVHAALNAAKIAPDAVRGIGLAGQMHGFALVGHDLEPLRPAIIWMDRRSAGLIDTLMHRLTPEAIAQIAGNRLSPGFAGASLAWLREHEPDVLRRARVALQPKDYIATKLTGELSSDASDASATWLYDIRQRAWSRELADACNVALDILPPVYTSPDVVGTLRSEPATALGLPPGIPVVAGSADQGAMLLGAGIINEGQGAITIATGGQITVVTNQPRVDAKLRLNTFCHALPERWYTMGAILNGGIALRWWRDILGGKSAGDYSDLLAAAEEVPAGSEDLLYLPYLAGERSPHMNPDATGAFVGLTMRHTQAHLTRAVLEGVAHAFRDCLDTLAELGSVPKHFVIGGGGARGALWRQIMSNTLGVSTQVIAGEEHTATGAAMLAGLGTNGFASVEEAVARTVRYGETLAPEPALQSVYNDAHHQFRTLYRTLHE